MFETSKRYEFAQDVCRAAGELALSYFKGTATLRVEQKGPQDWVSEADKEVETFLRARIEASWPSDGIYGEEHENKSGESGFDWVIDPIDGTTNFVNGIPAWTVVLAGVSEAQTETGVIHDPNASETFSARRGFGATLNGQKLRVASDVEMASGSVAVGYSNRVPAQNILPVLKDVVNSGAMFHRNASGALSLAYVAAGRLLGYVEEHMNAWDCLAGQLLIQEAGGCIEEQDADEMIRNGGRVVAGTPDVFPKLQVICDKAWSSRTSR